MENIILIGMPASGKSTVGIVVAKRLGYDFIDSDLLIQRQEKKLLKEIIEEKGMDGFLEIENQVNKDIKADHAVIAPGGSVIYCEEAMQHLKENGIVVYLQLPYETIKNRIKDTKERGVVLRKGQDLRMLYEERKVLLEKYADIIICEDRQSLEETIQEVLDHIRK